MNSQPGTAADLASAAEPVALVLSRPARPGHEWAFEEVLHRLAGAVRGQPGHLDVTVLRPAPGAQPHPSAWARPLISVIIVIPLMQYAVMPPLTRATRGFLYPAHAPQPTAGAA